MSCSFPRLRSGLNPRLRPQLRILVAVVVKGLHDCQIRKHLFGARKRIGPPQGVRIERLGWDIHPEYKLMTMLSLASW